MAQKILTLIDFDETLYDNKRCKPFYGAAELLKMLYRRGPTYIYTLNTPNAVKQSYLDYYVDGIISVWVKDARTLRDTIKKLNTSAHLTTVIGNSWDNDIAPALEAGVNRIIHVNYRSDHPTHERVERVKHLYRVR